MVSNRYTCGDKHTRVITSLNHIRSVILNQPIYPSNFWLLKIKRWLYLFPNLEHASLGFHLVDDKLGLLAQEEQDVVNKFATQFAADRSTMKTLSVGLILAINLDDFQRMPGFKA